MRCAGSVFIALLARQRVKVKKGFLALRSQWQATIQRRWIQHGRKQYVTAKRWVMQSNAVLCHEFIPPSAEHASTAGIGLLRLDGVAS
jgi:hypothetical protein